MAKVNIEINEKFFVIPILLLIMIFHLIPLIKHSLPLGWDSGFYFNVLSQEKQIIPEYSEPMWFVLAFPLAKLYGAVATIKIIQFFSFLIFTLGTYLFVSKYFDKKTAIFVMLLVSMIPAYNRMYSDQYRNILAISFLPLFLYCSLSDDKKYIALAGVFLGLIGLSHRLIFIYACVSFGLYFLIRLIQKDKTIFKRACAIYLLAGIIASPFLIMSFLPSAGMQSSILLRWEGIGFQTKYIIEKTNYGMVLGLMSGILVLTTEEKEKKHSILLFSFYAFGFVLFTGLLGTPFLVYDRYLLLFSLISVLFSAPYISKLIGDFKKYHIYVTILLIFIGVFFFFMGVRFLNQLTPFIIEDEIIAFKWMRENIPENSILLIPSREHYWAEAVTGMNVTALEWYQLLLQQPPTEEVLIIIGDPNQSQVALENVKKKYNQSEIYVFFTFGLDPVVPNDYFVQQIFFQKISTWQVVNQWGEDSYLFKL